MAFYYVEFFHLNFGTIFSNSIFFSDLFKFCFSLNSFQILFKISLPKNSGKETTKISTESLKKFVCPEKSEKKFIQNQNSRKKMKKTGKIKLPSNS